MSTAEKQSVTRGFVCTQCSADLFKMHAPWANSYMLTDEVWLRVHPEGKRGFLCHGCLPGRAQLHLYRPLCVDDFTWCLCIVNVLLHDGLGHSRKAFPIVKPTRASTEALLAMVSAFTQ